jgi:hypothetical protein
VHHRIHNRSHRFVSWQSRIQYTPRQKISLRYILIPSSLLRFGLLSGLLSDFQTKNLVQFSFFSHACHIPYPSPSPWFDLSNDIWRWVQIMYQISYPFCGAYVVPNIRPVPRLCVVFRNKYRVLWCRVVSPKLKDHALSDVQDCLFNIFAATLYIWRPSPLSTSRRRAMSWWQCARLTWGSLLVETIMTHSSPLLWRTGDEGLFPFENSTKYS